MDGANLFFDSQPAEVDIRSRMRGFERRPTVYERRVAGTAKPVAISDIAPTTRLSFKPAQTPAPQTDFAPAVLAPMPTSESLPQTFEASTPAVADYAAASLFNNDFSLSDGSATFEVAQPNPLANFNSNLASLAYLLEDGRELVSDQLYRLRGLRLSKGLVAKLLAAGTVGLLALGLYSYLRPNPQPSPIKAIQFSAATAPVSAQDINQYAVPADQPKLLDVTYLGIHSRIKASPLKDGQLQAAFNINDTAWDSSSAKLGEPGTTVIAGQVSDSDSKGAFYNLGNLRVGDTVQVTRGDSQVFKYQVMSIKPYGAAIPDMKLANQPIDSARSCLNLVALVSANATATPGLNQRVIVYTEQIN